MNKNAGSQEPAFLLSAQEPRKRPAFPHSFRQEAVSIRPDQGRPAHTHQRSAGSSPRAAPAGPPRLRPEIPRTAPGQRRWARTAPAHPSTPDALSYPSRPLRTRYCVLNSRGRMDRICRTGAHTRYLNAPDRPRSPACSVARFRQAPRDARRECLPAEIADNDHIS